jgi:hypothetical protein
LLDIEAHAVLEMQIYAVQDRREVQKSERLVVSPTNWEDEIELSEVGASTEDAAQTNSRLLLFDCKIPK